jgi:hypothetical protein
MFVAEHSCDFEFHGLRRTCLSNWLRNGMREYEVMALAGHSNFETTHKFYVAISQDLLDRANCLMVKVLKNAPEGIRTPDLRIRNPLLYPAELRAQ